MPRSKRDQDRKGSAARLRRLRRLLGLTQRELALEFNVTHGAIAGWESGKKSLPGPVSRLLELYEEEIGLAGAHAGWQRLETSTGARSFAISRAAVRTFAQVGLLHIEGLLAGRNPGSVIAARTHAAVARNVAETLGNLKGFAMKVGQTLGYADFALPEPSQVELQRLLVSSPVMSPAKVSQIFLEDFGAPPRQLFAQWSATPFAAASIGQVHRARLQSGEEVAVKVQYPNIAAAIDADLRAAALVERFSSLLFRGQPPGIFVEELRERFSEECDYRMEAEHQERFRGIWQGQPGVVIPRVHRNLSTRRVLVSELAQGVSFEAFLRESSQAQRDRAGMIMSRFSFESIFRHGLFHADPHPGNYLFTDDGVVFLDFGCVKRFDGLLLDRWRRLMQKMLEGDFEAANQIWIEIGMVPEPQRYDFGYHRHMMLTLYEPWLRGEPFRFTPEFVQRTWRALMVDNPNKFQSSLPKDWVFVNRLQWGLYAVLARLGATGDFRGLVLDLLYPAGVRRPAPLGPEQPGARLPS